MQYVVQSVNANNLLLQLYCRCVVVFDSDICCWLSVVRQSAAGRERAWSHAGLCRGENCLEMKSFNTLHSVRKVRQTVMIRKGHDACSHLDLCDKT